MSATCLNCSTAYAGNFCPECGQKMNTQRVTFSAIIHEIPHSVFHIDKGFFFTFIQLLYRPGYAIKDYLQGKRVKYFTPIAYLLLLCAASSLFGHYAFGVALDTQKGILFPKLAAFFKHYPALMFCALTPFISVWSWLFNRDKQFNYWEIVVLNIYIIAQFNFFFIINTTLGVLGIYTSPNVTPMLICFIAYLVFTYLQFFKSKFTFKRLVRNTAMILLIVFTLINGLSIMGFMTKWWWW